MNETPLPLIVLAMTATGRPVVDGCDGLQQLRRSRGRRSRASRSRTRPTCRPAARAAWSPRCARPAAGGCGRRSRSGCRGRSGRRSSPPPSWSPPAARRRRARRTCGSPAPRSLAASAQPTPTGKPWPSGPVLVSTPGTLVRFGWPLSAESGAMNVLSSSRAKKPQWASVAYSAPAQWPLERMKRSRSGAARVGRVDVQHRAEERDEDVRDREVTADVAEAGAVDHRHDRAAHVGRHGLESGDVDSLSASGPFRGRCGVCCQHLNIHSRLN